jgi:hypothetical protein
VGLQLVEDACRNDIKLPIVRGVGLWFVEFSAHIDFKNTAVEVKEGYPTLHSRACACSINQK